MVCCHRKEHLFLAHTKSLFRLVVGLYPPLLHLCFIFPASDWLCLPGGEHDRWQPPHSSPPCSAEGFLLENSEERVIGGLLSDLAGILYLSQNMGYYVQLSLWSRTQAGCFLYRVEVGWGDNC